MRVVVEHGRARGCRARRHRGRYRVHVVGEESSHSGLCVEVSHPAGVDRCHGHLVMVREVAMRSMGGDGWHSSGGWPVVACSAGLAEAQQLLDREGWALRHVAWPVLAKLAVVVHQGLFLDAGSRHPDRVLFRFHFSVHPRLRSYLLSSTNTLEQSCHITIRTTLYASCSLYRCCVHVCRAGGIVTNWLCSRRATRGRNCSPPIAPHWTIFSPSCLVYFQGGRAPIEMSFRMFLQLGIIPSSAWRPAITPATALPQTTLLARSSQWKSPTRKS